MPCIALQEPVPRHSYAELNSVQEAAVAAYSLGSLVRDGCHPMFSIEREWDWEMRYSCLWCGLLKKGERYRYNRTLSRCDSGFLPIDIAREMFLGGAAGRGLGLLLAEIGAGLVNPAVPPEARF